MSVKVCLHPGSSTAHRVLIGFILIGFIVVCRALSGSVKLAAGCTALDALPPSCCTVFKG
jgi:hypothetical protein